MSADIAIESLAGPLRAADMARLAEMHASSLHMQMLTLMGRNYLRAFYRFVAASPLERIFVARIDGALAGACVITQADDTVLRRAVLATFPHFLIAAGARFVRSAAFRRTCWAVLRSGSRPALKPQILVIFTDPAWTGRGIGRRLIERAASELPDADYLYTKTEAIDSNRAIDFYAKIGFEIAEQASYAERAYLYMRKPLRRRA